MGYFPLFVDLHDKAVVIIGGGQVAARKAKTLLDFTSHITVIAPDICEDLASLPNAAIQRKPFANADLLGAYLAIAATDNRELNSRIAEFCHANGILVDVADSREDSTFLFPSVVSRGRLTVGISSGGASPTASRYLRHHIGDILPENMEEILDYLDDLRGRTPAGESRQQLCKAAFARAMELGRPLTQEEEETL